MAARNPRLHLVLERPLHAAVAARARRDGISLSLAARDLIKEALEVQEDLALGSLAEHRRRRLGRRRLLTHDELSQRLGRP